MLKKIYWKLKNVLLALRWCWRINIGDHVWYQGKQYIVINGDRCNSWKLCNLDVDKTLDNGNQGYVTRSHCKKVWTFRNIRNSFRTGCDFYNIN